MKYLEKCNTLGDLLDTFKSEYGRKMSDLAYRLYECGCRKFTVKKNTYETILHCRYEKYLIQSYVTQHGTVILSAVKGQIVIHDGEYSVNNAPKAVPYLVELLKIHTKK